MPTVIAAALGECVHVAGITNFLKLAEQAGWKTVFLGPAVPIEQLLQAAREENADLVGVSYRLTPETGERLLGEFAEAADDLREGGVRFAFGGTPPVAARAQAMGFFEACFDGSETIDQVIEYLKRDQGKGITTTHYPQTTLERIQWKAPYPLIRHHFGLPDLEVTIAGVREIAESRLVDVISLGIDQDAQANFFKPDQQDPRRRGAGGVPVRTPDDYTRLHQATRCGNYPLMRTYSGSDDFIRLAEMYLETIKIAWPAIPLYWFNQMDGRGPWDLEGSIREHQQLMAWYGRRVLPVEVNEPHHWGMRDAPDVVYVVSAYLSAYNARAYGVEDYIAQMMFNSPPGHRDSMDLAKMLAILQLIEPLQSNSGDPTETSTHPRKFRIWRQTRTGLLSYPVDADAARAHLAASIYLQMALKPHILHVVGYNEADHAATANDVIESCKLARRAIENGLGAPDLTQDRQVQSRAAELVREARVTLEAIRSLAPPEVADPLTHAPTLSRAVRSGILDAPQLKNNPYGRGEIITRIDSRGACIAVHPDTGEPWQETERLKTLASNGPT